MGKAWEWIKGHPYIAAAIVFAVGILIILTFFSGSDAAPDNSGEAYAAAMQARASEAASGNSLAGMQLQGQVASNQTNAERAIAEQKIASDERVAKIVADASITNTQYETQSAKDIAAITAKASVTGSSIQAGLEGYKTKMGVLESLFHKIVGQNPAMTGFAQDTRGHDGRVPGEGYDPNYVTHTETYQGSYGQSVSGNIGDLGFTFNVNPSVSPLTPWGSANNPQPSTLQYFNAAMRGGNQLSGADYHPELISYDPVP